MRSIAGSKLGTEVEIGDVVLSRKNAPLAKVALAILRVRKRCRIAGREIGSGIVALIRKIQKKHGRIEDLSVFVAFMDGYETDEVQRLTATKRKTAKSKIEKLRDQCGVVRALEDGLVTVGELIERLNELFSDEGGAYVICSTVHRFKGLEADRVFVLSETLNMPAPCGECGCWVTNHAGGGGCKRCDDCPGYVGDKKRQQEERNISYVAFTRARSELVLVGGIK